MKDRETPRLVKRVFEEEAREAELKRLEEEKRTMLGIKAKEIKSKTISLMMSALPDLDKIKLPKPRTEKQILKDLQKTDFSTLRNIGRDYFNPESFKVEFPFIIDNREVKVSLTSMHMPEGRASHTMGIDVSVLPHKFQISTNVDTDKVSVVKVSREKKFVSTEGDDVIGGRGYNKPIYSNYLDLEETDEVIDLLDFIQIGIGDKSIKPKNLTAESLLKEAALLKRRRVQE